MTSTINLRTGWQEREQKALNNQGIRKVLSDSILYADRPYRVLSFPAATWLFEQNMASVFADNQFEFVGLECDPKIHRSFLDCANGITADNLFASPCPEPIDMLDFAKQFDDKNDPYDLIYLDWLGTWSAGKKDQVKLIMDKNMINDGGHLCLTLMLWRGWGPATAELSEAVCLGEALNTDDEFFIDEHTINEIAKCKVGEHKTYGVTQIIKALAEHTGQTATLKRLGIYKEPNSPGKKFTPQVSLLFQIEKL